MSQEKPAQVIPEISVHDVEKLRGFYLEKLGFDHLMGVVGRDGKLDFCIVMRDGAQLMISRPQEPTEGTAEKYPTRRPLALYIEVRDVDAYYDQVRKQVKVSEPLRTQWWGDRNFAVEDPYGYRLWFYQTVRTWEEVMAQGPPPGVTVV